jgi:hypothetical protein
MGIIKKLKELFDETKVSYEVYNHPLAYTAQEIAQRQHFSGNEMAKIVMLKLDGKVVMAVVTGNSKSAPAYHTRKPRRLRGEFGDGRRVLF